MKPLLCAASVVRNFLNVEVGSWPPKAIDPSKPMQWQDRRIVRGGLHTPISYLSRYLAGTPNSPDAVAAFKHASGQSTHLISPVRVGDVLYVRESFCRSESGAIFFKATDPFETCLRDDVYAPGKIPRRHGSQPGIHPGWTPSLHMPKDLSRIHLEVMRIRVERACDISEEDAIAEGCRGMKMHTATPELYPQREFHLLWESLYGHFSTDKWCWVYDLKRIK